MKDDAKLLQCFADCFVRLDSDVRTHCNPPLPEFVTGIDPDDWDIVLWQPAALSTPHESLDSIRRVGVLPRLYEHLATSYRWPEVEIGVCHLLPNLPGDDLGPLGDSMFADPVLNNTLIPNGFSRFATAPNACCDPICFDLNRFANDDCPVVRLNHESILMHDTLGDVETVFGSFRELVHAVLAIETPS